MSNNNNLEFLSPDLYLRYLYGFEIIKKMQKNKPCQILDVGGRAGIMGNLIKQEKLPYSLTVVDSLPDNKPKTTVCDKYIQQDFLRYSTNKKIDYLVTFDVLEHVHDKETFINKCLSICDSLILTAPFKSDITDSAENIVDEYFLKYKGIHHPWLTEHFEQGLPKIKWLKDLLNSRKIKFKILDSNNVENWVNFMLPNLVPVFYTVDTKILDKINQYYNQNYLDLGDKTYPTYRKIFVTLPRGTKSVSKEFISKEPKTNIQKKINFTNMIIDFLTDTIKNEQENNKLKDSIIKEKAKLEQENNKLKDSIIKEKAKLEQENNKLKDSIIKEKVKLEQEIKTTKNEIDNYTILVNQITNSKFYKIWQFFCNIKKVSNI